MKHVLAIVISLFSLWGNAIAQRIPDSSVTGTARATVGLSPAITGGNSGIQNAYDPSWSMLVGNSTQTLLPRRLNAAGVTAQFQPDGTIVLTGTRANYSCQDYQTFGRNGESWQECTFVGYSPVTVVAPAAAGRGSTSASALYQTYSGDFYSTKSGQPYHQTQYANWSYTFNPVINTLGALTGYSFRSADDDYFYGTYNNPSLTRFSGSETLPMYFCDPQNACGYQRGSWTVSN